MQLRPEHARTEQLNTPAHRYLRSAVTLSALVAAIGLLLTACLTVVFRSSEQRDRRTELDSTAALLATQLNSEIGRYVDATQSLSAALGAQQSLSAADFEAVTAPLQAEQLTAIESVALVVSAEPNQVASTQATWRASGNADLTLLPSPSAPIHYFPVLIRTLRADLVKTPAADDLAPYPEVVETLQSAAATNRILVTKGLLSPRNSPLLAQDQQAAFILTAPAFGPVQDGSKRVFKGWVTVGLRAQDLADKAFAKSDIRSYDEVKVSGLLADGAPVVLSQLRATEDQNFMTSQRSIVVAQDLWTVEVRRHKSVLIFKNGRPLLGGVALIGGLVGTLLLTILVFVLANGRTGALRLVAARTSELQRDIARRERIEQDLKAAQELSEAQRADLIAFAGFAAHDLQAPLTVVTGYLDLIKKGIEDPHADGATRQEIPDFAQRAIRAGRRMRNLIDSLLTFARAREATLNFQAVDLQELIESVGEDIWEQQMADDAPAPRVSLKGTLPVVWVDEHLARRLFENLLGNAVKYVEPNTSARIEVSGRNSGDFVQVTIADHGIGIPPDRRAVVFEGFVRGGNTSGYAGSGLGLAICKRVVERHGGDIQVEENPGGGTQFLFTLPRKRPL